MNPDRKTIEDHENANSDTTVAMNHICEYKMRRSQ